MNNVETLKQHILELKSGIGKLTTAKNNAYKERNMLLAFLSKVLPSNIAKHDPEDLSWDLEFTNIIVINGSAGQMTWHIHDSDLHLFKHLKEDKDYVWDGHKTGEKYERLLSMDGKINGN